MPYTERRVSISDVHSKTYPVQLPPFSDVPTIITARLIAPPEGKAGISVDAVTVFKRPLRLALRLRLQASVEGGGYADTIKTIRCWLVICFLSHARDRVCDHADGTNPGNHSTGAKRCTEYNSHEQRKEMLRETLMPRFDWFEMARQTLGKHWSVAAGRENEFVGAFTEFLGNSYVGNISSYKDEKILFVQESIESNRAQVKTKIVPGKGEPTAVNYRLHRVEGYWKIYDVVVDDISIVVNYRSQFNRNLTRGTFDDLLRQLREKELGARN